jgi:hypothetical protein
LVCSKLKIEGLIAETPIVRNEGQYTRLNLGYASTYTANITLRPHILLEFTLSKIRLPTETLYINTMIEDTFAHVSLFNPRCTPCISVGETAIEKWVGLTRRIVAKQFKNQHPEYSAEPRAEIEESLNILKNKPIWRERYNHFIDAMVYDKSNVPEYNLAIESLKNLSAEVMRSFD